MKGAFVALLILVSLGTLGGLVMLLGKEDPGARDVDLNVIEAMPLAMMPVWAAAASVVVSVAGIWFGGKGNVGSEGTGPPA